MVEKVSKNMVVSVHYTGTLPGTGEVFDSSEGREPLSFIFGHGQMIPGFEEELMGASKGEKREFTLPPEKAYGNREEEAMLKIPRSQFAQLEQTAELKIGIQLVAQMPHGPAPFTIVELDDESITADFNHALAGETLTFNVEVVEVRSASEEEMLHGHVHPALGQQNNAKSDSSCTKDGCC